MADKTDDEPNILDMAMSLASLAMQRLASEGEQGGFWQYFDAAPGDSGPPADFTTESLTRSQGREFVGVMIRSGFRGVAAFGTFEQQGGAQLWIEVYNTDAGTSVGAAVPLKRTFLGKLRAAGSALKVEDIPSIPGAFDVGTILARAD
jgi:hypothetical protein